MGNTITKPVFDIEITPVQRSLSVAYLHDVDLDDDQTLAVGDRIELRDEGGFYYAATVEAIEPARLGRRYRVHLQL
jgi:hypothetical protein